jgi:GntR family transcriptional regulator
MQGINGHQTHEVKRIPPTNASQKRWTSRQRGVYVVERLRYIQDEPLSYHISISPPTAAKTLRKRISREQLCVILDKEYGFKRGKVVETLESILASDKSAKLLMIKNGYPLLLLENVISDTSGKPFEYTRVFFRGDKIKIKFEFET